MAASKIRCNETVRHAASEHGPSPSGYDAELRRHNEVLRRAVGVQLREHALDIGCGTGQTTREAARMASAGSAFGIDISVPAIERARELARADGLRNVTFGHANAQVHRFAPEHFDFAGVAFTDVCEPVYYGPDVAAALDWVRGFRCTSEVLKMLDPAAATRAVERLREVLATHMSDGGVWFNSRAWIVTARCSSPRA
jgi:SAM-dependent methyltransferase